MERALRNIHTAAATPSNSGSGYPRLTNYQLAEEIQKFAGYNHLSNSAAGLFEEVIRRLMAPSPSGAPYQHPLQPPVNRESPYPQPGLYGTVSHPGSGPDSPVSLGSIFTHRDLDNARASVHLNLKEVLPKNRFKAIKERLTQRLSGAEADELILEFKKVYNLSSIIMQGGEADDILGIYWMTPRAAAGITSKNNVFWRWEPMIELTDPSRLAEDKN